MNDGGLLVAAFLHVPENILQHDNRVIDDAPNRHRQAGERHNVERDAGWEQLQQEADNRRVIRRISQHIVNCARQPAHERHGGVGHARDAGILPRADLARMQAQLRGELSQADLAATAKADLELQLQQVDRAIGVLEQEYERAKTLRLSDFDVPAGVVAPATELTTR